MEVESIASLWGKKISLRQIGSWWCNDGLSCLPLHDDEITLITILKMLVAQNWYMFGSPIANLTWIKLNFNNVKTNEEIHSRLQIQSCKTHMLSCYAIFSSKVNLMDVTKESYVQSISMKLLLEIVLVILEQLFKNTKVVEWCGTLIVMS